MKPVRLFLFRHADKRNELHSDPELNPVGLKKAQKLSEFVTAGRLPRPTALWSSPKKRALQTLTPLSKELQIPLQESKFLLESQAQESHLQLQARIESFIEKLSAAKDGIHFICTHYDWTIACCELVLGTQVNQHSFCQHWKPCQYIEFDLQFDDSLSQWMGKIRSHGVVE